MAARSVWILNHYAHPPDAPGGTRHYELARRLVERGYDVTIMASVFHHATRERRFSDARHARTETIHGVRFVWIESRTSYRANDASRVTNMVEYALRAWWGGRRRFAGEVPRPDVVIGSSPHLLAALAASRLACRFRVPFVLEIRDLWPETIVQMGVLSRRHPTVVALRALERFLYRRATRIVSLLPSIGEYLRPLHVADGKVAIIPNGVDVNAFACPPPHETVGPLRVVYVGAHGPANGLANVVDAAERLTSTELAQFHFYGDGSEKAALVRRVARSSLGNALFHDPVPKKDVPAVLCSADVLLLHYARIGIGRFGISPNKLSEYMASGRPVLFAHEAAGDPVGESGCGLSVPPGDPEALAAAVCRFARMPLPERIAMGARGRAYVEVHHDWDFLAARLADVLDEVVAKPRSEE
jgi:glycosyltransferase involved in cell wall biosynthesis